MSKRRPALASGEAKDDKSAMNVPFWKLLRGFGLLNGEPEPKAAPLPQAALDTYLSPVGFNGQLTESETQPSSNVIIAVDLAELSENGLMMLWRDATPLIDHSKGDVP